MTALVVIEPGPLALVEDLGRPGHAGSGVSTSGALDRAALRLANRLVGNDPGSPALELLGGGAVLRFEAPSLVAVAGAFGPVEVGGRAVSPYQAVPVGAGAEVAFGFPLRGVRYYLAARGGIDARRELGSASADVLSGLGPAPLESAQRLRLGAPTGVVPVSQPALVSAPADGAVTLRATPGPRADWFSRDAVRAFWDRPWRVSADSNRVGMRLEPLQGVESLDRAVTAELPSEAMVAGAVQVPPSGRPTVLLADHPVTGGYPVIAVVRDVSLDALGQLAPGRVVRFR